MNSCSRPLPLLALALLGGCASHGDFPSLAPRPAEYELTGKPMPPCIAPAANPVATAAATAAAPAPDVALGARIDALLTDARRGQSDFEARLPAARTSIAAAGPSGSEGWIAAQQALSRLEAARVRTQDALADLDALALEQSKSGTAAPEDLDRLTAAAAEARGLAEAQQAEVDRLGGSLH